MAPSDSRLDDAKNQATINANSKAIPLTKNNQGTGGNDTANKHDQSIKQGSSTAQVNKAHAESEPQADMRMAVNALGIKESHKVHTIP